MVWYSSPRIFQVFVIHTVKGFILINEAEVDVFLEFSAFSVIQPSPSLGEFSKVCYLRSTQWSTQSNASVQSVQLLSRVQLFVIPWIATRQASLSITNSQSSCKHIHWVSDAIQPSHPLSFTSPPAPNPSQHQSLFQWVNSSHEVAKVLEFQL